MKEGRKERGMVEQREERKEGRKAGRKVGRKFQTSHLFKYRFIVFVLRMSRDCRTKNTKIICFLIKKRKKIKMDQRRISLHTSVEAKLADAAKPKR